MTYKRDDMLDLNEENVKQLFKFCMATKDTKKDNIILGGFIKNNVPLDVPNVPFNKENLLLMRQSISYIMGQLKFVHNRELEMRLQDGFKKYDGTNWTKDKGLLFALYYLGCSSTVLPFFVNIPPSKDLISQLIKKPDLKPTLSPNDSNFEMWCKENDIIE